MLFLVSSQRISILSKIIQRSSQKKRFEQWRNARELETKHRGEDRGVGLQLRLPAQERLHALLHQLHEDLASVSEWLEIYDTPVELNLESEKVWPTETFIKVQQNTAKTENKQNKKQMTR